MYFCHNHHPSPPPPSPSQDCHQQRDRHHQLDACSHKLPVEQLLVVDFLHRCVHNRYQKVHEDHLDHNDYHFMDMIRNIMRLTMKLTMRNIIMEINKMTIEMIDIKRSMKN